MGLLSWLTGRSIAAPPSPRIAPKLNIGKRRYDAAKGGRLFADWVLGNPSIDQEIRQDLRMLRARSRDLSQNDPYAKRYLRLVETNVVGPDGIRLQMKVKEFMNGAEQYDQRANDMIEEAWGIWGKAANCTQNGRLGWIDVQRHIARAVAKDGEVFVRKVRGRKLMHGFSLQLIEADLLDEDFNGRLSNGNEVRMGVEVDAAYRPVAYHFWDAHPNDYQYSAASARNERRRVPATDIIHLYDPESVSATRGVPWMVTPMGRIKMLNGYQEAELVGARVAAGKMGFFVQPEGGDNYVGDGTDAEGNIITEASPGSFEVLPTGYDFREFSPEHPSTAYGQFSKDMLKGIASGLNVSYVTLANDLEGVNYSSIRQGTLDERDHWRMLQGWLIRSFHIPVFEEWLLLALTAPDGIRLPIERYDKFNKPAFIPRGWQWVDPQKEVDAALTAIDGGLSTLTKALGERGDDVEEILRERANEKALAESLGVELVGPKTPKAPPTAQEGSDAQDAQDNQA